MKRIAFMLAALLPVTLVAGITAVSFQVTGVTTGNTAFTQTRYNVSGKLLEVGVSTTTTSDVQVVTTANIGSSISGAKTLLTNQSVTNTLQSTPGSTIYLYNDTVVLTATNGVGNADTVSVILLLDTDP